MDRLFSDGKISEMIPCDFDSKVFLYPVRHHSPVCSYHLIKAIEKYAPQCILIEGPCNANELISSLTNEETVLPCAFYYYFKDTKGMISEDKSDYKCYYPFMEASPEYNALCEAKKLGIPAEFIDLPYSEILINTSENRGLRGKADKHSYADDSLLSNSSFFKRICEKTGLRNFEEFWEKYFEINGLFDTTEKFIKQMHTYCILTRESTPEDDMNSDGTPQRELFMAQNIREAMKKYERVMVVTGGFHSLGLYRLISSDSEISYRFHNGSDKNQGCYPMAYSYDSINALHGYASGMEHPGFYDSVFLKLKEQNDPKNVYNDLTFDLLLKTAKKSMKRDIPVSMSEMSSAHSMMDGLSAMRNCRESGIYELQDAVTSCFIKGEKTISSSIPLAILNGLAGGSKIGSIGDKTHVPPLVTDFEYCCSLLGIKCSSAFSNTVGCNLFTAGKGMETSRFLHRMEFLNTGFAKMEKGPDLHRDRDRNRVREEWKYRRVPGVDAVLIDHTTDGFTIEEACRTVSSRIINNAGKCSEASDVAIDCFLMGIKLSLNDYARIEKLISSDSDMFSVSEGLRDFKKLYELQELYGFEDVSVLYYAEKCFDKLISSLPSFSDTTADLADSVSEILKVMNDISSDVLENRKEDFIDALQILVSSENKEPVVLGAAMGILCAFDPKYREEAKNAMSGFLTGSTQIRKQGAGFIKGLFSTARDIVFEDKSFLSMTDELICSIDYDDFIEILPLFRLAFSNFTPHEIKMCAASVADLHGKDADDLIHGKIIDENFALYCQKKDSAVTAKLAGAFKALLLTSRGDS